MKNETIPFLDLVGPTKKIKSELLNAVERVLDSGNYILGSEGTAFEKEFAKVCETPYALGLANGTCALHLVLRGLGLQAGDEVITCSNSFLASASTIALAGGKPVFVDIDETLNMDPNKLEAAITPKTKGVMPVHLTGRPARMDRIMEIARKHKLFVLEDAAQSIGAKLNGKPVGSWGDAAAFSLHPLKNLHGFGDGGMLTTHRADLVEYMTMARNHGLRGRNECEFWSFNCRLDEIQAAMLGVQMKRLNEYTEKKRRLAVRYHDMLRSYAKVPEDGPGESSVYQTYVIQVDRRDELQAFLAENGVDTRIHYPMPIHKQKAAASLGYKDEDLPVTSRLAKRILSLPLFIGMTDAQQDRVAELIAKFYKGR